MKYEQEKTPCGQRVGKGQRGNLEDALRPEDFSVKDCRTDFGIKPLCFGE
jgi:hypothetical protein